MIRIFIFLLLVLLLGFGFSWFADRPGDVALQWQGNQYETSLMVVLVGFVALVAGIMILWWLARTILDSPRIMQRFFKTRKKDRGYQALTKGLIAANSGDSANARRFTKESIKLLGHEPLVELLDAQSSLLEGNREEARARFETMLDDDDTRLVALRGLYLEAERQGAGDAAKHYANEAHKSAPSLGWAGNAKLRYAAKEGNWEAAIATLGANKSAGLISKDEAKRQRAVLLTAQAMSVEPADPTTAAKLAREAHKLAPTLVPAAIIGAKALARNSDLGRASGMLETVWKNEPHPELAQSYIHLRLGDSASDRLKRAKKLAGMKPNHPEGNYIIAEAAIDGEDWKLARRSMMSVLTTAPTERACLIMADLEEGQSGDQGRMREWLSRAVRSPKDAAWTADGYVSQNWLPISPVTGKIDAFEWKVPVEQLGAPNNAVLDAGGLEDLIREPQPASQPVGDDQNDGAAVAGGIAGGAIGLEASLDENLINAETAEAEIVVDDESEVAIPEDIEVIDVDGADGATKDADTAPKESTPVTEGPVEAVLEDRVVLSAEKIADAAVLEEEKPESIFPLDRRPDDPGVRREDKEGKPKRFGLF